MAETVGGGGRDFLTAIPNVFGSCILNHLNGAAPPRLSLSVLGKGNILTARIHRSRSQVTLYGSICPLLNFAVLYRACTRNSV